MQRAVDPDGTGPALEPGEQPLGLAECVGAEQRRPARRGVLLPPVHDVRATDSAEGQSKTGRPKVLSVTKTSQGTASKGVQVGSASVL